jgi:hypothetical protein
VFLSFSSTSAGIHRRPMPGVFYIINYPIKLVNFR